MQHIFSGSNDEANLQRAPRNDHRHRMIADATHTGKTLLRMGLAKSRSRTGAQCFVGDDMLLLDLPAMYAARNDASRKCQGQTRQCDSARAAAAETKRPKASGPDRPRRHVRLQPLNTGVLT